MFIKRTTSTSGAWTVEEEEAAALGVSNKQRHVLFVLHPAATQSVLCHALVSTLLVAGILGVMARVRSRGEVLVAVRDQRGEWVDGVGRLHHGDFVGL